MRGEREVTSNASENWQYRAVTRMPNGNKEKTVLVVRLKDERLGWKAFSNLCRSGGNKGGSFFFFNQKTQTSKRDGIGR